MTEYLKPTVLVIHHASIQLVRFLLTCGLQSEARHPTRDSDLLLKSVTVFLPTTFALDEIDASEWIDHFVNSLAARTGGVSFLYEIKTHPFIMGGFQRITRTIRISGSSGPCTGNPTSKCSRM
jgi:hypothetical protein